MHTPYTEEALGLFEVFPVNVLILTKNKNAVAVDNKFSFQTIAISPEGAINVKVPRGSGILPC